MSLRVIFTSDDNAEFIVKSCIEKIYQKTKIVMDKNDKDFFEIFNSIASSVFSYHIKKINQERLTREETIKILNTINRIVISEIVKYTCENIPIPETTTTIKKKITSNASTNTDNAVREIEEELLIELTDKNPCKNLPQNIKKIELVELSIFPEIYNITSKNNSICIDNHIYILEEGYYDDENLCKSLSDITNGYYKFTINDIDRKMIISKGRKIKEIVKDFLDGDETFKIDAIRSSLLKNLGFSENRNLENKESYKSDYPVLLNIDNNVMVKILIDDNELIHIPVKTNYENKKAFSQSVVKLNHTKFFGRTSVEKYNSDTTSIYPDKISFVLDNYFPRNRFYSVLIKVSFTKAYLVE